MKLLIGNLIVAGDIILDEGELVVGLIIEMDRETLTGAILPMYKDCVILTVEEYDELKGEKQ